MGGEGKGKQKPNAEIRDTLDEKKKKKSHIEGEEQ